MDAVTHHHAQSLYTSPLLTDLSMDVPQNTAPPLLDFF